MQCNLFYSSLCHPLSLPPSPPQITTSTLTGFKILFNCITWIIVILANKSIQRKTMSIKFENWVLTHSLTGPHSSWEPLRPPSTQHGQLLVSRMSWKRPLGRFQDVGIRRFMDWIGYTHYFYGGNAAILCIDIANQRGNAGSATLGSILYPHMYRDSCIVLLSCTLCENTVASSSARSSRFNLT